MTAEGSEGDEYLNSIYTQPFVHGRVVWSQHTTLEILEKCREFEFRPDDVIIATYPRSGTTLTQEIVWQIVNHDIVRKGDRYGSLASRFPFFEMDFAFKGIFGKPSAVDSFPTWTKQRLIKTHLPYSFISCQFEKVNPKMIIVMRNPKDNVVSSYTFYTGQKILKDQIPFAEYWRAYMTGKSVNGDFVDLNLQWWDLRDRANVLIVRYEDIVRQPSQEIRKMALFLGYSLCAEKIEAIAYNTSFDAMSSDKELNVALKTGQHQFLRKGKIADWKNWLTVAQNEDMDSWIREHFSEAGLRFIYE